MNFDKFVERVVKEFGKKSKKKKKGSSKKEVKKPARKVKISMLDGKRNQQLGLSLGKFRMNYTVLATKILECDDKLLTLTALNTLSKIVPTQ